MRKPRIPKPKSTVTGKSKTVAFHTASGHVSFEAARMPKLKTPKPKAAKVAKPSIGKSATAVANKIKASTKPRSVSIKF
jgi:hypothetical protein